MSDIGETPRDRRRAQRKKKGANVVESEVWTAIGVARHKADAARSKRKRLEAELRLARAEEEEAERALREAIYGPPKEVDRG